MCACTPLLSCVCECEGEIKAVPDTCLWNSFGSLCSPVLNWKLSDLYPHISSQVRLQGDERLLSPSIFSPLLVFLQPGSTSADYFQYDSMNAVNWQIKGEPGLHLQLHELLLFQVSHQQKSLLCVLFKGSLMKLRRWLRLQLKSRVISFSSCISCQTFIFAPIIYWRQSGWDQFVYGFFLHNSVAFLLFFSFRIQGEKLQWTKSDSCSLVEVYISFVFIWIRPGSYSRFTDSAICSAFI